MHRKEQGFTLIELMIVVAIIAILAAIAIPLYLNYTARAQSSEAISLASGLKPDVVEYFNDHGTFTGLVGNSSTSNNSIGAAKATDISGKYVSSVEVPDGSGQIIATFCTFGNANCQVNQQLSGATLTLSPITHGGSIDWSCFVSATAIYKLVPANCRHSGP